jgi:hypothetical protein
MRCLVVFSSENPENVNVIGNGIWGEIERL